MNRVWLATAIAVLLIVPSAFAGNVLIQDSPWGTNIPNETDMSAVFGSNYTEYNYTVAPSAVFVHSNLFVFMEGGDGTQTEFENYLTANSATILNWVSGGGQLLLQEAGWNTPSTYTFGPGTFTLDYGYTLSPCGTLTAAGVAAFPGTPVSQCGNYLAHEYISGTGLTNFMTSNNDGVSSIVSGIKYGNGYIMYSGLTDSQFHNAGGSLNQDVIAYTYKVSLPEPGTLVMFGSGLLGLAGVIRRKLMM